MSKLGNMTLTGASGTEYVFGVYPLGTPFKAVGAVYATSTGDAAGNHDIHYIGQTGDLSARFADHHKEVCWESRNANAISVLIEPSEKRRFEIETDLVRQYAPACNG